MRLSPLSLAALLLAAAPGALTAQTAPSMQPPSGSVFEAFVGNPVSIQFQVVNPPGGTLAGPFALTGQLPPGLSLNSSTGLLSGTVAGAGTFSFQVSRTYTFLTNASTVTYSGDYSFNTDFQFLWLTSTPLAPATSGVTITRNITVSQPATWGLGGSNLPPSIELIFPPTEIGPTTVLTGVFPAVRTPTTYTFTLYAYSVGPIPQSLERNFSITVNPPPAISGPAPAAVAGSAYASALTATLGTPPYTFSILSGALPPGLALNPATGGIAGIPNAPGTYNFVGRVTDSSGATASGAFSISVAPPPLSILTGPLPQGRVGEPYSTSIGATGGVPPYRFSLLSGSLPPGISLASDGRLQGTPSQTGTFSFAVQVTDNAQGSSSGSFSIQILPPPLSILTSSLPDGAVGVSYSATLSATGGEPLYRWAVSSGSLPPGLSLSASGVISGTPSAAGSYQFGVSVTDSAGTIASRTFTVRVENPLRILTESLPNGTEGAAYSAALSAAGGTAPYSWSVSSGSLPPGLTLNAATGQIAGTPTAAGAFSLTVAVTDSARATASRAFSIRIIAPLIIVTESLPPGIEGAPYSSGVSASGGTPPYSWSLSGSLPPGLALNANTGAITGTPTAQGSFSFTVTATDSNRVSASRTLSIQVNAPLQILTSSLPDAVEGRAYSASIQASGGAVPYSFSIAAGQLPPGLTLSSGGSLSGEPSQSGDFIFTVRVTDRAGYRAERELALRVLLRPRILTEALPDGRVGEAYSATLSASGRSPFSWSISGGSLPQGLSLNAQTGAITGTPAQPGSFSLEVTVSDGNQPPLTASRSYTLRINLPPLPNLSITQLQDTTPPASQPAFGLQLNQAFPLELNGTATLSFAPDSGLPQDPAIRFANGATSVNFTIPAGQTAAVPASGSQFAFQTGTTAGTITLSVVLRLGSTVLEPSPFVVRTVRIPPSGPVITNLTIVRTPAGFEIRVTGYSNIREITGATFRFTAAPGASLGTAEISVPVASVFQQWFASETSRQFGGQFLLVVPFTLDGNAGGLASVQVTLTNSAGSGSATANF